MKRIIITSLILIMGTLALGQFPKAIQLESIGSGNAFSSTTDILRDGSGNIIISGYFNEMADFGGVTLTSKAVFGVQTQDGFIAKYSPSGTLMWVKQFEGTVLGSVDALALDNNDNIFFVASGRGGMKADATVVADTTQNAVCFGKMLPNGNVDWVKGVIGDDVITSLPGVPNNRNAIEVAPNGDVYLYGSFEGDVTFDGTPINQGPLTCFLAGYENDGDSKWYKQLGNANSLIRGLSLDMTGNVFIAGNILADNLMPAVFDTITISTTHVGDPYLARFEPAAGDIQWFKTSIGGLNSAALNARIGDIQVHRPTGNVYLTGRFARDTLDFGNGVVAYNEDSQGFDFYIAQFDNDGVAQWIADSRGAALRGEGRSLDLDGAGNVYILGTVGVATTGGLSMILGQGMNSVSLGPTADVDLFVAKYTVAGALDWAKFIFGKDDDFEGGIAFGGNNTAFITGAFKDTVYLQDTTLAARPVAFSANAYVTQCDGSSLTSIESGFGRESFRMYPQPAHSYVKLRFDQGKTRVIQLFDALGKRLFARTVSGQAVSLDLAGLQPGIYLIEARTGNIVSRRKLQVYR